jgi:hypothetical protein
VLPFRITQRQAADAIKVWLASRWFAPNALVQLAKQELAGSVYLPFWTYDAYATAHYSGQRGEHYWETETYADTDSQGRRVTRMRQVRKTRWYPASGTVERWFDDILLTATKSVSPLSACHPGTLGPRGTEALSASLSGGTQGAALRWK